MHRPQSPGLISPQMGSPQALAWPWGAQMGAKTFLSVYNHNSNSHDFKPSKDFLFKTTKVRAHGLKPSL